MVQLKYIGTHQPTGMIVDVDEDMAKELLKLSSYEPLIKPTKKVEKEEVKHVSKLSRI